MIFVRALFGLALLVVLVASIAWWARPSEPETSCSVISPGHTLCYAPHASAEQ